MAQAWMGSADQIQKVSGATRGPHVRNWTSSEGGDGTAMENAAEQYDLITVLLRLESFKGQASKVDRSRSVDDLGVTAANGGQGGLFQKILGSLQRLAGWPRRTGVA